MFYYSHFKFRSNFKGSVLTHLITFAGDMVNKTAKSFLFEVCAVSYWKPPEFELCKEEGPSHLRR